ncbi:MAG TPA: patatin-like phospholipase family protein [Baekduia sp.]|uniref:patatin-like phospholipase family protein n=1 Tax=Baekduia sp. TaxID=2600305 RepID=UPI002C12B11D|nr:patatin-like phospholipase family protein [Baekduia sp.]HMJ34262.1 patatin-like phospholipase family protein [Baekduia sp.]
MTRPPRSVAPQRPLTAFVLAGGASLGAVQVGMLRALYERNIVPDLLVGASVGALNAAFVASRAQDVATADALARVWASVQRQDVFPLDLRTVVGGLSGRRDHLVGAHALRRIVRRYIGFEDLADSPIPLHIATYDLVSGREVLLSAGPAVDAVLAATAIPGILPPVQMGELRLLDAAVVNNTPISHAVALGAERIYVLPTQDPMRPGRRLPRNALECAIQALGVRTANHLQAELARYAPDAELIVLPAPSDQQVRPTDFGQARRLTADALAGARMTLALGGASGWAGAALTHLYAVPPPS